MKILELPSPDLRHHQSHDPLSHLLTQFESLTFEAERLSPGSQPPENLTTDLRRCLAQLSQLAALPNPDKLRLWKLSYRLWNACVDLSNADAWFKSTLPVGNLCAAAGVQLAELRHACADLLTVAGCDVVGVPSPALKAASFYYKTGLVWHDLGKFELASGCFDKATNLTSRVEIASVTDRDERKLFLDLSIARARTAWEVSDRNVSVAILNRGKKFLFELAENYRALANQYFDFGKTLVYKDASSTSASSPPSARSLSAEDDNLALKLLNDSLDLCEKGLRVVKKNEESLALKLSRDKTLRFIAALHLQREEFESVIKCVRVLRDGGGNNLHPSLTVLALKAWLGLGRHAEAEKELRGVVVCKGISEGIWLSAIEAYFKTVGVVAGGDTVRSVFNAFLARGEVSPRAAVRVILEVIGNGGSGEVAKASAILAAELASDSRVVEVLGNERAVKEKTSMQAILWNCGASHFRLKDYKTGAELIEKSLLYVPSGTENKILRAKGFRVLCLCHLGLFQLDQAREYIDEAEKLQPNVTCAFLKFKILLQRNDYSGATHQMQVLSSCTDFTMEYLSLAAHEAVASRAFSVASSTLSHLLNFYSSGKSMPVPEVVVFRTLITILTQDPGNDLEVLKYMKRAQTRIVELGPDLFFGKGEVGRRERNWIAVNSWNLGTKAGSMKKFDLCSEFLKLSSEFCSVNIDGEIEVNEAMMCRSMILTVSAMIAAEKHNNVPLVDAEVRRAIDLLNKAGKMLSSSTLAINGLSDCQEFSVDPTLHFMHTFNAYELYGRLNDSASQLLVVKNYVSSKHSNPNHLLQIGISASQGPYLNPEVAVFVLNSALSTLLASPSPEYQTVAVIIRKLIIVASVYKGDTDDDLVFSLYKQAYRITVGLNEGDYPIEEGKWLATTAWNRASFPARLGDVETARKWMSLGLELAKEVPGMEAYKSSMEDFVAAFEKNVGRLDRKDLISSS